MEISRTDSKMQISRTDFDDMNLNSLISVFNNELFEKFRSERSDPEIQGKYRKARKITR